MREGKYKNYTEASKFIYAELRKCENRIADELIKITQSLANTNKVLTWVAGVS